MPKTHKKYGIRHRPNTRRKYRKKTNNVRKNKSRKITRKRQRRQYGRGIPTHGIPTGYRGSLKNRAWGDTKAAKEIAAMKPTKPKRQTEAAMKAATKAATEAATCPICFDEFDEDDACEKLPCCGKKIGKKCIIRNVLGSSDVGNKCPLCRNEKKFFPWVQRELLTQKQREELSERKTLVNPEFPVAQAGVSHDGSRMDDGAEYDDGGYDDSEDDDDAPTRQRPIRQSELPWRRREVAAQMRRRDATVPWHLNNSQYNSLV